jgi:hypothetical protein
MIRRICLWTFYNITKRVNDYSEVINWYMVFAYQSNTTSSILQWVSSLDLTTQSSLSPIRRGFAPSFVNYKKGCTRLAAASDKAYQLLARSGHHDIAEILLKVALNTKIQNSNSNFILQCINDGVTILKMKKKTYIKSKQILSCLNSSKI